MANVSLEKVSKRYAGGNLAVDNVSFEVADREFLVLVGPSGCGKSSTLRLIAGLEVCDSGTIRIGQNVVNQVAPKDRNVAMVFQNYALYPHMSVYKNLAFGLWLRFGGGVVSRVLRSIFQPRKAAELRKLRAGVDHQVRQTAERLAIEKLLDRKPYQLSGGERQRVALGRAIVRDPAVFLFDEPLSNLDANLRQQMRAELKRLHQDLEATMVYVTHDQVEAMTLGDRIAVMKDGRLQQIGKPLEVYRRPANLFVAKFIGAVPANIAVATVSRIDSTTHDDRTDDQQPNGDLSKFEIEIGGERFSCPAGEPPDQLHVWIGELSRRQVLMGFRPEQAKIETGAELPDDDHGTLQLDANVVSIDRLGDNTLVGVDYAPENDADPAQGDPTDVNERDRSNGRSRIVVRVQPDTMLEVGQAVKLKIRISEILWFDPDTGENINREIK